MFLRLGILLVLALLAKETLHGHLLSDVWCLRVFCLAVLVRWDLLEVGRRVAAES